MQRIPKHNFFRNSPLLVLKNSFWQSDRQVGWQRVKDMHVSAANSATSQNSPGIGRHSVPALKTLCPERMVPAGQQIIDFAGWKTKFITGGHISYCSESGKIPFPQGSRGVLYYHSGSTDIAGQVRLRICDDVSAFEEGHDLLVNGLRPWSLSLSRMVSYPHYQGIVDTMLRDGLVTQTFINEFRTLLLRWPNVSKDLPMYSLSDPFYLDVSKRRIDVKILTWDYYIERIDLWLSRHPSECSGILKVRFERSTFPEHSKLGPTLVLKVIEVAKPIQSLGSNPGEKISAEPGGYYLHECRGKIRMWKWVLRRSRYKEILNKLLEQSNMMDAN